MYGVAPHCGLRALNLCRRFGLLFRDTLSTMASLVRCPKCDTFVKTASSCPFCSAESTASHRNPLPGLVLAAAVAAMPSCTSPTPANEPAPSPTPSTEPVLPADDAATAGQPTAPVPDPPAPVYGGAPSEPDPPPPTKVEPKGAQAVPGQDVDVYGIAPE